MIISIFLPSLPSNLSILGTSFPLPSKPHVYLLVVFDIDLGALPLASWDLALELDINLTIGETLHLRQVEVSCDQAKETGGTPDVAALAAKVSALQSISNYHKNRIKKRPTVGLSM